jgi:hypothetical protein
LLKRPVFEIFPEGKSPENSRFWQNSGLCLLGDFPDKMLCQLKGESQLRRSCNWLSNLSNERYLKIIVFVSRNYVRGISPCSEGVQ